MESTPGQDRTSNLQRVRLTSEPLDHRCFCHTQAELIPAPATSTSSCDGWDAWDAWHQDDGYQDYSFYGMNDKETWDEPGTHESLWDANSYDGANEEELAARGLPC